MEFISNDCKQQKVRKWAGRLFRLRFCIYLFVYYRKGFCVLYMRDGEKAKENEYEKDNTIYWISEYACTSVQFEYIRVHSKVRA